VERQDYINTLYERHACKQFDAGRTIPAADFNFIVEAGRLSPSSFGLEHWHFLIIRSPEIRKRIQAVAWNQPQVIEASELMVILARKNVRSSDPYMQKQFGRRELPEAKKEWYLKTYAKFIDSRSDVMIEEWSKRQCYLSAANMMNAGAFIGVDSCPLEGFDTEGVEAILEVDTAMFSVALMIGFGYRSGKRSEKLRLSLEEIVTVVE